MAENQWRFNSNGGNKVNGLNTADIETFAKDSMASLAREICQNSIDAKDPEKDGPVELEFHSFSMLSGDIPGYQRLLQEFDNCKAYWSEDKKTVDSLDKMQKQAEKAVINCLRISDFNTTGLTGISKFDDHRSHWFALLHGSGMAEKTGNSGGSKGIGKYATFANSLFRTAFYSTKTKLGEVGYEGLSYLCTGIIPDSLKNEVTEGLGYYGSDEVNDAILGNLTLDKDFKRREADENGTDIYILGFNNTESWKRDIISKILDSFMVAIFFGKLVVRVDDVFISKDSLKDIVYNPEYVSGKSLTKSIVSQFILLSAGPSVSIDHIDIDVDGEILGTIDLYSKQFEGDEAEYATNKCTMVRSPYMKIKDSKPIANSTMSVSALCIIQNDNLNSMLREIENPQHIDWEVSRIEDAAERSVATGVISQMNKKIVETVFEQHIENAKTALKDNTVAGEYLPAKGKDNNETGIGEKKIVLTTKPRLTKHTRKVRTQEINTEVDDPNGNGVIIDTVSSDENGGEESSHPEGHNAGHGGSTHTGVEEESTKHDEEGHSSFVRQNARGTSYRFFCTDKQNGKYILIFTSLENVSDGELELYRLDIAGGRSDFVVDSAVNPQTKEIYEVVDKKTIKLHSKQNEKIIIEMKTPYREMFSVEAHFYKIKAKKKEADK